MGNKISDKKANVIKIKNKNKIDDLFQDKSKDKKLELRYKITHPKETIRLVSSKFYENNKNKCKM